MSGIGLKRLDAGHITGELNEASPRLTSAKEHQICTLATVFTYWGTTISFLKDSPVFAWVFSLSSKYTLPLESTTCQCGSGVSGTTKSLESVRTLFPSLMLWVTVPVFTLGPLNCDDVREPICAKAVEKPKTRTESVRATATPWRIREKFMEYLILVFRNSRARRKFPADNVCRPVDSREPCACPIRLLRKGFTRSGNCFGRKARQGRNILKLFPALAP